MKYFYLFAPLFLFWLACNGPVEAKGEHHAITLHITDNDFDAV